MLECWNGVHKSRITYQDDPWCQRWPHPPTLQSETSSVLQVWLRWRGALEALLNMLESKKLVHKVRITYQDYPWCQGWPHPPRFQSGTFNILKVWLQGQGGHGALLNMQESKIWYTSQESYIGMIHDVKDVPIPQDSSQEPSAFSKYDFKDGGFLRNF